MPKTIKDEKKPGKASFFSLMLSVFAAAFGVQSSKNRERDFQQSSILPFIFAGIIFTALFMIALILIVKVVI